MYAQLKLCYQRIIVMTSEKCVYELKNNLSLFELLGKAKINVMLSNVYTYIMALAEFKAYRLVIVLHVSIVFIFISQAKCLA